MALTNTSGSPFKRAGTLVSLRTSGDKVNLTCGTITDGVSALYLSATMPTTIAATNNAVDIQVTSAGASNQVNRAFNVDYITGYTGANATVGVRVKNDVSGTGTDPFTAVCNSGLLNVCSGVTSGTNIGLRNSALNGAINYGEWTGSIDNTSGATNIGIGAFAYNVTGSPTIVAGYFGLMNSAPTYVSGALVANNGTTAHDIFLALDNQVEVFSISNSGTDHLVNVTGGTMTDQKSALYLSATMPTTISGTMSAIAIDITSAGSSAQSNRGLTLTYLAGYTGASLTSAGYFGNGTAGTGTDIVAGAYNAGVVASATATTTGTNLGCRGAALGGNVNVGFNGMAIWDKASAVNIGTAGYAHNAGGGSYQIGGWFGLYATTVTPAVSSALVADNGAETSDILNLRDNNVEVFSVSNSGTDHLVNVTAGTMADQKSALYLSATMPTSAAAYNAAVFVSATSSNSTQNEYAFNMELLSGGSADKIYSAGRFVNLVAGVGNEGFTGFVGSYNSGIMGMASATTAGTNLGGNFVAYGGNKNAGVAGTSIGDKNSATNIGVYGVASNAGSSPVVLGGFFGIMAAEPTFASAALMADNGSTSYDIFVARDGGTEVFSISNNGTDHLVRVTGGTMTDQKSVMYLDATMPATLAGANYAIDWRITGAGSSAQRNCAFSVDYIAGYTGASETISARFVNRQAGTGATPLLGNLNVANYGFYGGTVGTTTGTNVGAYGTSYNGNVNYGLIGESVSDKTDAKNIGVAGFASQTSGTPIQIGGFFGLMTTEPTYASAALMADNGATASPVAIFRDNGSAVYTIADGGTITSTGARIHTPENITATSDGVAASVLTVTTNITTNGDSDLDNVTLANGTAGQIKIFAVKAVGNAADSVKITPATMVGGSQITFAANPLGLGCVMEYTSAGWVVVGNNGGTIS